MITEEILLILISFMLYQINNIKANVYVKYNLRIYFYK